MLLYNQDHTCIYSGASSFGEYQRNLIKKRILLSHVYHWGSLVQAGIVDNIHIFGLLLVT